MRSLSVNLVLFVLSTIVSLVALEQAFRFYLFGSDSFSVDKINSMSAIGRSGLLQASTDPGIIYELKPHLDTYFKMVPFSTNSRGLRDREYPLDRPPDAVRVAVIGDSFTMPAGVRIEEAYHSVLETRLNADRSSRTYELINFGVGGYSLQQYVAVIEGKALAYEPDLILVGFCAGNDYKVFHPEQFPTPYRPLEESYPFWTSFVWMAARPRLAWADGSYEADSTPGPLTTREKRYLGRVFERLASVSERADVPLVLVYLSNKPEPFQPIASIAIDNGIQLLLDTSTAFVGTELHEYRILPIDNHPNGKAHRIFADRIFEYLVREDLLRGRGFRS